MKTNKVLCLSWILIFLLIVKTNMGGKHENTAFQGIAETREVMINSENAVEIRNIHVTSGQVINKGRLLVELERPELTMKINEISHQLEELRLQGGLDRQSIHSQISQFKAEKKAVTSEASYKISQLESRYNFNKEITAELESINTDTQNLKKKNYGPLEIEIQSLKKERQLNLTRIQMQIDTLEKNLASPENPVGIRIKSLENELNLLAAEKKKLLVYARMDGMIGSVLCKTGEKVSPFIPIMTLYTQSPSYVKAYIHEKVHHRAAVGEKVKIVSLGGNGASVIAQIVGTGSRIVEYPVRLRKRPDFGIWGREVEILLPEDNSFLLGEKVMVYPLDKGENYLTQISRFISHWANLSLYAAESRETDQENSTALDIQRSKFLGKTPEIEASGLVYLADLNKFLVISDETHGKKPVLYFMDQDTMIREQIMINGIDTIDDMEALCQDKAGNIYVCASQSREKNGNLPDNRKLLVKIQRQGTRFQVQKQILLHDLLKSAAEKKADTDWARFIKDQDIEIEGMFCNQDSLYLGFKKPLKNNRAVILKISGIDNILDANRINPDKVELWKEMDLQDQASGNGAGISDLFLHENRLYVLSTVKYKTGKNGKNGALRVYDENNNILTTKYFQNLTPEGITFDQNRKDFVILFDQGKKHPSKIIRMQGV